jgi:hypothetical protein
VGSATEPVGPIIVKLFVYAAENADLQHIAVVAKEVAEKNAEVATIETLTWPEARDVQPTREDVVVSVFTNNAVTRRWIGATPDGAWSGKAEVWRAESGFFYLKPSSPASRSFDDALVALRAEEAVLREVQAAWYGKSKVGLSSLATLDSVFVDLPLDDALRLTLERLVEYLVWRRRLKPLVAHDITYSSPDGCDYPDAARDPRPQFPPSLPSAIPPEPKKRRVPVGMPDPGSRAAVLRDVRFAAYGPYRVQPARNFVLDVWAFNPELKAEAEREATRQGRVHALGSKGPMVVAVGRTITVAVTAPSFRVEPSAETVVWDGRIANTSFTLCAEADARPGAQVGTATITSGGVPIAVVHFEFYLKASADERQGPLWNQQHHISTIFASYASHDRIDVLQWARGAEIAGVDVFLDVLSLREGTSWESEVFNHVPTRDLFCLFWSAQASESKWVEIEWRCALGTGGLDYIHPVPLVDPRTVPPPRELKAKHFSDVIFIVREYEKEQRKSSIGSDESDSALP